MKRFSIFLTLFIMASSLFPADYSLLGDVYISGYTDSDATSLSTGVFLDHRFTYQDGAFGITQELDYSPQHPETFNHRLYTAYADIRFTDEILFSAGKFRIPWTKAVYFTALDKINPSLSGLDTDSPREGFWGVSLLWTPNMDTTIVLCTDISEDAETGTFYNNPKIASYVSRFFGNLDLFISGIYQYDAMALAGTGFSYNLFDYILYSEAGIEIDNSYVYPDGFVFSNENSQTYLIDELPITVSAGIERLVYLDNSTLSFIVEYLFTESGYSKNQTDDFYTLLYGLGLQPNGQVPRFGKQHLVLNAGLELTNICTIDNSILFNLTDGSIYQTHSITLIMLPDIDFETAVSLFHGDNTTELGFMTPDYRIDYKITFHF